MSLTVPVSWKIQRALEFVRSGIIEVRPDGTVWRIQFVNHGTLRPCAPRRIDHPAGKGYRKVTLHDPAVGLFGVMAHTLVFIINGGTLEDGQQINHKNLIKDDNRFENLEACSQSKNIRHSYDHGRTKPWTSATEWRPGRKRLTSGQIRAIQNARKSGQTFQGIANAFGLSKHYVFTLCKKGGANES